MIEFKSTIEHADLIGPSGNEIRQTIEHRIDPLTGVVCSINNFLGEKARTFLGRADIDSIKKLEEESRAGCPFCQVLEEGIRFPAGFSGDGFVKIGDSVGIPNLFSKTGLDGVIIVNHARHNLFPSTFGAEDLGNAVRVGVAIMRKIRKKDPAFKHHVLGMNFLLPGGSSVPHPHLQVQARSVPYSGVERLVGLSRNYHNEHKRCYWTELIDCERENKERYMGRTGDVNWLVPVAPVHQKEVWGVLDGRGSLFDISDEHASGFAEGISRVISFYENEGQHPFTFSFFSSPEDETEFFSLQVRLAARPAFKSFYANYDTWFVPKLIGDEVHIEAPEEYARRLTAFFPETV